MKEERSRVASLKSKLSVDIKLGAERPEDVVMARNVAGEREGRRETLADTAKRIKGDSIFGQGRTKQKRPLLSFDDDEGGEASLADSLDFTRNKRH